MYLQYYLVQQPKLRDSKHTKRIDSVDMEKVAQKIFFLFVQCLSFFLLFTFCCDSVYVDHTQKKRVIDCPLVGIG